jgi:hypothetical protein
MKAARHYGARVQRSQKNQLKNVQVLHSKQLDPFWVEGAPYEWSGFGVRSVFAASS